MCLIGVAGKGKDKYSEEFINALRTAAITNTDGIGFTYKKDKTKEVYISKGYTNINKALKAMRAKRIALKDELIVHLRIGNRGSVNKEMCHPFVLADNATDILANNTFVDKPVVAHNGTFYGYNTTSIYSDTFQIIQELLHHPTVIMMIKEDLPFFEKTFSTKLGTNKLAFLFPNCNNDITLIGDFIEDDGYFYSNRSYKTLVRNVGGSESSDYFRTGRDRQFGNNNRNDNICSSHFDYNDFEDLRQDKSKAWKNRFEEDDDEDDDRIDTFVKEKSRIQAWNGAVDADFDKINGIADETAGFNSLEDIDEDNWNNNDNEDEDENDETIFGRPKPINLNESILQIGPSNFIKPSSSEKKRESISTLLVDEKSKIVVRSRTGYRKADKHDLQIPKNSRRFKDERNGVYYHEDRGLYLPEEFKTDTQFPSIQIVPSVFNYTDLVLKCIKSDPEYNIVRGCNYLINEIPEEPHTVLLKWNLNNVAKTKAEYIFLPDVYLHQLFEITFQEEYRFKYKGYYELLKRLNFSSDELKSLTLFMKYDIRYREAANQDLISYQSILVQRSSLDLFKYNCAMYVYGGKKEAIKAIDNGFLF